MSKCLYRKKDGTWIHSSAKGHTVNLRWYLPNYRKLEYHLAVPSEHQQFKDEIADASEISLAEASARLAELDLGLDPTALRWEREPEWQRVFKALNDVDWSKALPTASVWAAVPKDTALIHAIPQTRLRRFYEFLRLLPEEAVQASIASYVSGKPRARSATLQVLFADSRNHFARYDNPGEPFHDRARTGTKADMGDSVEARELVSQLFPGGRAESGLVRSKGGMPQCRAVDYEISPFRTTEAAYEGTRAVFENGMPGRYSGCGGIDLLLRSEEGGLPIIAEVKGPDDTNLFLALVQALTYVAELTTPNQIRRLAAQYGQGTSADLSGLDANNPRCDVFLIFFEGREPALKDEAVRIAKALLKDPESPVARIVRRIAFVRAVRDGQELYDLECAEVLRIEAAAA